MPSPDVRLAKIGNNNVSDSAISPKKGGVGSDLATGNDHYILPKTDDTDKKNKEIRQNILNKSFADYKINKEDGLDFLKKLFNYTEEQLTDPKAVAEEKFLNIMHLFEATMEFLVNIAEKRLQRGKNSDIKEDLSKSAEKIQKMLDNGYTIEQATNFIENFQNLGILQILQIEHPELKKYNSLEEVPEEDLNKIVKAFIDKFVANNGTNNKLDIGQSYQIISNLMERATSKEAQKLMNAFFKVTEGDERFEGLKRSIRMLKDKPETLDALLNDETLKNVLHNLGIKPEQIKDFLTELFNTGMNPKLIAEKIGNYIQPLTDKYNELKNKKDLTPEELQFIQTFESIDQGNIQTVVEFLLQKIQLIGEDQGRAFLGYAQNGGFYDDLMRNLADFFNNNKNDEAQELLNTISDNKFNEICEKQAIIESNEYKQIIDTSDIGLPQRVTQEKVTQSQQYLSQSPIIENNQDNNDYVVLGNNETDYSLLGINSKSYSFVREGLNLKKYTMPDLIGLCTTQQNGVKKAVSEFFENLDKDRFTFYLNQLSSNILKTEFILGNNKVEYDDIKQNVKLTYNAMAQVEEKSKENDENKNKPELT